MTFRLIVYNSSNVIVKNSNPLQIIASKNVRFDTHVERALDPFLMWGNGSEREGKPMAHNNAEIAKKWLENRANPAYASVVGGLGIGGLQVVSAQPGRILCNFLVPKHLADKDGDWRAGAISTLIDSVGSLTVASATGCIKVSVDFNISYFSTAKINEEVEIEARTLAHMGKLTDVTVEIRKKESREVDAVGRQWMASTSRGQSKL